MGFSSGARVRRPEVCNLKTVFLAMLLVAVPLVALAPTAEAGPECMPVYREYHVGDVTVVQRSSCGPFEVYYQGEPILR